MVAKQLVQAGKVREAQQALGAWLRDHPTDVPERTFLFELLCFSGDWDRAAKQLALLAEGSKERELGAVLYFSALHAERTRHDMFRQQIFPDSEAREEISGALNGKPVHSITDADPNIGARLEIFAAGSYMWLPFEHIQSIHMEAPRRLRDTLWATAIIETGPKFRDAALGEVLVPVIYPFSWKYDDQSVWLGRETVWVEDELGDHPLGQKLLLVDDEEVPLLEIREVNLEVRRAADHG